MDFQVPQLMTVPKEENARLKKKLADQEWEVSSMKGVMIRKLENSAAGMAADVFVTQTELRVIRQATATEEISFCSRMPGS